MKKILMLMCVAMLLSVPNNVFAETDEEVTGNDATVSLIAAKASSYTVKLPKTVDVTDNTKTFDIFAKGDISADKQLVVTCQQTGLYLEDVVPGSNKRMPISASISDGTFTYDALAGDYTQRKAVVTITHESLPAGNFHCDLPVTITLAEVQ